MKHSDTGRSGSSKSGRDDNPLLHSPKVPYKDIEDGSAGDTLRTGLSEYGMVYITDIPSYRPQDEISAIKAFFESSYDSKMEVATEKNNPVNKNILRGYGCCRDSRGELLEEVFNIGQYAERTITPDQVETTSEYKSREANVWPKDSPKFNFKDTIQNAFDVRFKLARLIVHQIASSLDYVELENKFDECEFSMLVIKKYLPRDAEDNVVHAESAGYQMLTESGQVLACPEHADTTITLLSTYTNSGLQGLYGGVWYDVPNVRNSLLLMAGSIIEELTDGKIKALRHRVLDIKTVRYAAPFFFNPSFNADVSKSMSGKTLSSASVSKTYGPWQVEQLHRDEPSLLSPTSLY